MKKTAITSRKTRYGLLLMAIISVLVVGTRLATQSKNTNTPSAKTIEKTSLRLKWINQAQFAGYFMASKNNHYKDAGLDVRIDPAGPNISPTQMVTSGVNEFGIAGADEILQARAKGVPIVAIAVMFKANPESLTSFKSANIREPKDLIGKRIGVIYGNDENLYRDFMDRHGITKAQVTEVAAVPGASQLLAGQVDALMAYSMNVPVQLELQGKEVNIMKFADYGVKFYGDTLFTTEKMIKEHPEKVRKFVQASIHGWKDALNDPDTSIAEVLRINPTLNKEAQIGYLKGIKPLIEKDGKIGHSEDPVWNTMLETLRRLGVIKNDVSLKDTYTTKFLEK